MCPTIHFNKWAPNFLGRAYPTKQQLKNQFSLYIPFDSIRLELMEKSDPFFNF